MPKLMGSTARMENIQPRFDSVPIKESTSRCFIVRVLLIMGLLQIASSVALLLYFSHQIAQVRMGSSTAPGLYFRQGGTRIR